jgi:hypothetical protein
VYTILSFIFSSLYYPFYAIFLSPALGRAPNSGQSNITNVSQQGGKGRRR